MFFCLLFKLFIFLSPIKTADLYHQFDHDGPVIISEESRLHEDLFFKERRSHPTNQPLDVTFGLVLKSIVDYDAVGEAIVISAFIRQKWKNPVLSWDPNEYGGIKKINVRPDETWVPDIYAYYDVEAQFKYNGLLDTMKTNIILSHDGSHFWLAPIVLNLGCGMNVKDFPFDIETCALLFGSFTHDKSKLNLISENVDLKTYTESSEWVFKSMNHTRHQTLYPGSTVEFSDIKYTVILKRKPLYYVIKVFYPTFTLTFLTILVFIQPIAGGERTVYLITILLALCWYVTSGVEYLPSSSEGIPLSQLFIALALFTMSLLSLCLCYSIGIHYGGSTGTDIPPYLRKYVLEILGPYMGYELRRKYPLWRENLLEIKGLEAMLGIKAERASTRNSSRNSHQMDEKIFNGNLHGQPESLEETLGLNGINEAMIWLDEVLEKLEIDDDNLWMKKEWTTAALILDRLFLYCFSLMLAMTVIYCFGYAVCVHPD